MDKAQTTYDNKAWRHLPTDTTMNAFRKEYKQATNRSRLPSEGLVKSAIESTFAEGNQSILYRDIFSERNGTTQPILIPWEINELLVSILKVWDSKKDIDSNKLCDEVLNTLVESIKSASQKDITGNYLVLQYIHDTAVQQKLLLSFKQPFDKRLDIIRDHIFNTIAGTNIDNLQLVLERLDIIIDGLEAQPEGPQLSSEKHLQNICRQLMIERNKLLSNTKLDYSLPSYNWNEEADSKNIELLKEKLKNSKRDPSENEKESFLKAYQEYLISLLNKEDKDSSLAFWHKYTALHRYFFEDISTENYVKAITEELHQFARNIFVDLDNLDTYQYAYSGFTNQYASTAYTKAKLADIHRDIQIKVHHALRLLLSVNAYLYYNGSEIPTTHTVSRMMSTTTSMLQQIQNLSQLHTSSSVIDPQNKETLSNYVNIYREKAKPIFYPENPFDEKVLHYQVEAFFDQSNIVSSIDIARKFWATYYILKMECQLVIALEIEKAAKELGKDYTRFIQLVKSTAT